MGVVTFAPEVSRDPLACKICRTAVSTLVHWDGQVEYLHARSWETYDHEPDPMLVARNDVQAVCDFCTRSDIAWEYFTQYELILKAGNSDSGFGTHWVVCNGCDTLIRHRDLDGLLQRHFDSEVSQANRARWARERKRELLKSELVEERLVLREMMDRFLSIIVSRQAYQPPEPVLPITARRLHRVRTRLTGFWADSEFYMNLVTKMEQTTLPGADCDSDSVAGVPLQQPTLPQIRAFTSRMQRSLATADLYWVSPDFTKLSIKAGKKLPNLTLSRGEVPTPSGLALFAEPITELVVSEDGLAKALIVALTWTLIPGGVWLTLYCQPEQVWPDMDRDVLRNNPGPLFPVNPGMGLPFDQDLTVLDVPEDSGNVLPTLLAFWFLMRQPGVAETRDSEPDRKESRAYARKNAGASLSPVRLVDLRRSRSASSGSASSGTSTRVITKRSLVGGATGGFWRNQVCGPHRAERRPIWIDPFVRGPDGAPFADDVPTVRVVR
jgi:hypothetical protein